jgi:hypothetical protein
MTLQRRPGQVVRVLKNVATTPGRQPVHWFVEQYTAVACSKRKYIHLIQNEVDIDLDSFEVCTMQDARNQNACK